MRCMGVSLWLFGKVNALKFEVFSLRRAYWVVGSACGIGSWGFGCEGGGAQVEERLEA